eukprot:1377284-Pyramimonas_sp.AAC.1
MASFDPDFKAACEPLDERATEVLAFAEQVEPWEDDGRMQFTDANLSLRYLAGPNLDRPIYTTTCPVIAASSKIFVRGIRDGKKYWALLPGSMVMRLIGYPTFTSDSLGEFESKTLSSLGGNAFSGYHIVPVLMGAVSVLKNPSF